MNNNNNNNRRQQMELINSTLDQLVNEQLNQAKEVASEICDLDPDVSIDAVLLLDALACAGIQLTPITEHNLPSLAYFQLLGGTNVK